MVQGVEFRFSYLGFRVTTEYRVVPVILTFLLRAIPDALQSHDVVCRLFKISQSKIESR